MPSVTVCIPFFIGSGSDKSLNIDWGDEMVSFFNSTAHPTCGNGLLGSNHTFAGRNNTYEVVFSGSLYSLGSEQVNSLPYTRYLVAVDFTDSEDLGLRDLTGAFSQCTKKIQILGALPKSVISLRRTFHATQLEVGSPVPFWNVAAVEDMTEMFLDAITFNDPLNDWNVSSVTDMRGMFLGASSFDQALDRWNVSSVTDMSFMFSNATSFNGAIHSWDVSNVRDMSNMFSRASAFNGSIGSWDTHRVENTSSMFLEASSFNQPIGTWNVSRVKSFDFMFYKASAFNQNLRSWCNLILLSAPLSFSEFSALSSANAPTWGPCEPPVAPPVAPPISIVVDAPVELISMSPIADGEDICRLFLICPSSPAAPSGPPGSSAPSSGPIVTIPSNSTYVLQTNVTTLPNTLIIFQMSSTLQAGTITTGQCLTLSSGQLKLVLEPSALSLQLNGTTKELIVSFKPECFVDSLPSVIDVEVAGPQPPCVPLMVSGQKVTSGSTNRVSLSVLFTVRSSDGCQAPNSSSAASDNVPVAAIVAPIVVVVVLALGATITIYWYRTKMFRDAESNARSKLNDKQL